MSAAPDPRRAAIDRMTRDDPSLGERIRDALVPGPPPPIVLSAHGFECPDRCGEACDYDPWFDS